MPALLFLRGIIQNVRMLVLFTDFSLDDPYVGQMKAVLHAHAPSVPIIDLLHRVPDYDACAGAHLLHALADSFPPGSVFLCVVDAGVGSCRPAVAVEADGKWYVGPDNGLLSVVAGRSRQVAHWRIVWRPEALSASFHGRDLFAPVAARLAMADMPNGWLMPADGLVHELAADDLFQVIYIDHYGNAMTGIRGTSLGAAARVRAAGREFAYGRVFSEVARGEAFWYVNSCGLVEVAISCGHAARSLGLRTGMPVSVVQ